MKRLATVAATASLVVGLMACGGTTKAQEKPLAVGSAVTVTMHMAGKIVVDRGATWLVEFTDPSLPWAGIAIELPKGQLVVRMA